MVTPSLSEFYRPYLESEDNKYWLFREHNIGIAKI